MSWRSLRPARPILGRALRWSACSAASAVLAACGGCQERSSEASAVKPPTVAVAAPLTREETPYLVFTGRTEAVESVTVRARVSGYIDDVAFADGSLVKAGDLLFQIDPRPYRAALSEAQAAVAQAQAGLTKAEADLGRARPLLSNRAISQQEFDLIVAQQAVAAAAVQAAEAAVEGAQLNLDFTTITAPIAGRISRTTVTKGNLISEAERQALTTIVSVDPIQVDFDIDERSLLALRANRAASGRRDQVDNVADERIPLEVALATDKDFTHQGRLDFVDNRLDAGAGTLRARGLVSSPDNPLLPGLFVRVRLVIGKPQPAVFVAERAVGIDQGQRYAYLVNAAGKVEYHAVEVGASRDGLRQIKSPLPADARVIVEGLHRVRSGIEVTPQDVKMTDFSVAGVPAAGAPVVTPTAAAP